MDAVVAEKMGVGLDRAEIVDGHHLDIRAARLVDGAQDIAPDASESVDCDLDCHLSFLRLVLSCARLGASGWERVHIPREVNCWR